MNASPLKCQLGYVVLMAYKERRANVVQYRSSCCHRVLRPGMAAEMHVLVHATDTGMAKKNIECGSKSIS